MEHTIRSQSLRKSFIQELRNIYWVEKQMLKVLPKLERASKTRYLKASFKGHISATCHHVNRIEEVFRLLNENVFAKKCAVVNIISMQAKQIIKSTKKNSLERELGLINTAQKIEHYEIDTYGKLIRICNTLGEYKAATLLEETLAEEKEAEETFDAIKDDTLIDDVFKITVPEINEEEFEAAEEE